MQVKIRPLSCLSSQKGFQLLELLITLVIVGIITAIAIPNYLNWLPDIRLKSAARDLFSNLQSVRMEAIKTNKSWAIVFDTANNRYVICSDKGPGGSSWSSLADNTITQIVNLSDYKSGVAYGHGNITGNNSATEPPGAFPTDNVSFGSNVVVFNNKGTGSAGYVYLENEKKTHPYAVGVRSSGSIKIKRWTGSKWE